MPGGIRPRPRRARTAARKVGDAGEGRGNTTDTAVRPAVGAPPYALNAPELIPPARIRRNESNPRLDFNQKCLELLADSLDEQGVLVPVTVYRKAGSDGTEFVLLDGERRWRAAREINAEVVPAWVVPQPTGIDNVLRMFHIHMLRDEWGEMATAKALKAVIKGPSR